MGRRIAVMAFLCLIASTGRAAAAADAAGSAQEPGVDLEIVLVADVSRSIDEKEFALQRKGYAAALTDSRVLWAIQATRTRAIGLCFVEWAGEDEQRVVVDWSRIGGEADGAAFAAAIRAAPRSFTGRTSISAAIDFAAARFAKARWPAARRVIDVSGDGTSNAGRPVVAARDAAAALGITINGLVIINNNPDLGYSAHTHPPGGLPEYYRRNVLAGADAFLVVVKDFASFAEAMAQKLAKEIAGSGDRERLGALR